MQALLDAGLPIFTAPGGSNTEVSTAGESGCPPPPPIDVHRNTSASPVQAGQAVLGCLGWLNAACGHRAFDVVGYRHGGLVARATAAASKRWPAAETMAPGFPDGQVAVDAGISIPSIVTLNGPHFASPGYDVAFDPTAFARPVLEAWRQQFVDAGAGLRAFQITEGAGAIQVLSTTGHAKRDPRNRDAQQAGVLDGADLTLVAGDYCGQVCAPRGASGRSVTRGAFAPTARCRCAAS